MAFLQVSQNVRVLIVSQYFYPESFRINDLVDRLIKKDHQVLVLTGLPNYPNGKLYSHYSFIQGPWSESVNGVQILRVPIFPRGKGQRISLILNYLSFVISALIFGLPRLRKFGPFDSIFVWASSPLTAAIPGIIYGLWTGNKPHIWIQDLWPESISSVGAIKNNRMIQFIGQIVRWIYSHSANLYIQSKDFYPSLKQWGAKDEQIIYLPNWADRIFEEASIENTPGDQNSTSSIFQILFAGNLGHAQDLWTILDAVELLPKEASIQFHFIGNGSCRSRLQEEISNRKLHSRVKLFASRPLHEMPRLYQCYDALLVSLIPDDHLQKVLPSKVQSYLVSGKPILAMADGETKRVITESGSGYVCSAGDARGLAENCLLLAKLSLSERKTLGDNGRSYYWRHYSAEEQIRHLTSSLQKATQFIKRDKGDQAA